jgi:hypothetical protein
MPKERRATELSWGGEKGKKNQIAGIGVIGASVMSGNSSQGSKGQKWLGCLVLF